MGSVVEPAACHPAFPKQLSHSHQTFKRPKNEKTFGKKHTQTLINLKLASIWIYVTTKNETIKLALLLALFWFLLPPE